MPGLRTVHASFGDYLYIRAPNHLRIRQSLGHEVLARGCLDVMAKQLCFNISASRSSYEPNPPNRPDSITLALEYACLHWSHHFAVIKLSKDFAADTLALDVDIGRTFRPNLLFWLEVLSALGKVRLASGLLLIAGSAVSLLPLPLYYH